MNENTEVEIDVVTAGMCSDFVAKTCTDEMEIVQEIIAATQKEFGGIPEKILLLIIESFAEAVLYKYVSNSNLEHAVENLFNAKMSPGEPA
jgi:hypothetical protein